MRLRIDTNGVKFRVAGMAQPRTESRKNKAQRTLNDGRPVWVVKLTAIDSGAGEFGSTESIWVEFAGPRPELVLDEFATVEGLTYAPYIGGK
jgi:hypothetical protein